MKWIFRYGLSLFLIGASTQKMYAQVAIGGEVMSPIPPPGHGNNGDQEGKPLPINQPEALFVLFLLGSYKAYSIHKI